LGTTTSSDFAPAANDHGFFTSIDVDSNTRFSNFYYNVSFGLSGFADCQYIPDRDEVIALGEGN